MKIRSKFFGSMMLVAALVVSTVAPSLFAQESSELKNVAVVAGANWDKLMADITYLGTLAGKPEVAQMIEGGFSLVTQGKGPMAIDHTKAWGVIVQTDGQQFLPVGCLPMVKPEVLFDVAKGYGAEIKDGENGVKKVMLPNRTIYVKVEDGMAFLAMTEASLERLPKDPQQVLTKLVGDYDLVGNVLVRNVPEMYRQLALTAMQSGMKQNMKQKEDESDDQFALRQKMAEAQMQQMERLIKELDSLKFGWAVDKEKHNTYADVTYTFLPDSKFAKQMGAYSEAKTNFAGFFQPDAAATAQFATKADPSLMAEDMAQFEAAMKNSKEQLSAELEKKIEDEATRKAIEGALGDWIDAFADTMKTGQLDGAAALHASPESLTFISGMRIKDPKKVESGFKKIETAAKDKPDFPGIKWNAATHGGVTFHTTSLPVPENEKGPRKLLGEKLDISIGIGPETAYLGIGNGNMEALTKAIDESAANKGKSISPFELVVSIGPLVEVAASQAEPGRERETAEKVAEFLKNEAKGQDHFRATGQMVPNGLKYHLEVEEGVLKAIGKMAQQKQRQALPQD